MTDQRRQTGAEAMLGALADCGVRWLFANAGTDFPPVIEALAQLGEDAPEPVTIPHETAAVAMAHGVWLVTGAAQAVMVHVNVGLANAAMGVINAASDDVPVIVMSGRTPITETGRVGSRVTPIQYGQEMYDQSSIVRDAVRFSYEMRYPEQGDVLVKRAHAIATAAPGGPVYLSLPREPLAETVPEGFAPAPVAAGPSPAMPDPAALARLAVWLAEAERPVILCQRGDVAGRLGPALSALGRRCGIGVAEPFSVRNVMASGDPALIGYDAKAALEGADVVVVLDSGVPWIAALHAPGEGVRVAHVGPDPQFRRMPVRGYRSDLSLVADPVLAVEALAATLPEDAERAAGPCCSDRGADRGGGGGAGGGADVGADVGGVAVGLRVGGDGRGSGGVHRAGAAARRDAALRSEPAVREPAFGRARLGDAGGAWRAAGAARAADDRGDGGWQLHVRQSGGVSSGRRGAGAADPDHRQEQRDVERGAALGGEGLSGGGGGADEPDAADLAGAAAGFLRDRAGEPGACRAGREWCRPARGTGAGTGGGAGRAAGADRLRRDCHGRVLMARR